MRALSDLPHPDLIRLALDMELTLIGLRSRLGGIARHADGGPALTRALSGDASAEIDRVLGPAGPITVHVDPPARQARVDALAPVPPLLLAAE